MYRRSSFVLLVFITFLPAIRPALAQPVNVRVSPREVHDAEEVSIAVAPHDARKIAVGANLRYLFSSDDSGATWQTELLTSQHGVWGDPALLFGDTGQLYYIHLAGSAWREPTQWLRGLVMQTRTPEGLWTDDTSIGYLPNKHQDKPTIVQADYHSFEFPIRRMLLSWTQFDEYGSALPTDSSHILLSTSNGASWSAAIRVNDVGGDCIDADLTAEGAVCAGDGDGRVFIAWMRDTNIFFDRANRDLQFGKDRAIASLPGGWDFNVPGIFRANGFPTMACDTNIHRLYLAWSDQRKNVTRVYSMYSDDNGETWQRPLVVNGPAQHAFFPSMAFDRTTGQLGIVYYRSSDADSMQYDVYFARSRDHGVTWTNERISENAFRPTPEQFFGDYISIAAVNGAFYPCWMRSDSNALSVWMAKIVDTVTSGVASAAVPSDRLWVRGQGVHAAISFELREASTVTIESFDATGANVRTLLSGRYGAGDYRIMDEESSASAVRFVRMTMERPGKRQQLVTKYVR